jgi:hypothetical protein
MSTDVNYSIKGTTDVPQQVDKSKKAMSEFERQSQQVSKKFGEFGKDIVLGFLAPMVLLNTAINYISTSIEARKREVKEALDFANTAEAKLYASQQEIEAAKRRQEQQKEEQNRKTAEDLKLQARLQFFAETPEGKAKVQEFTRTSVDPIFRMKGMEDVGLKMAQMELAKSSKLSPELQAAFDKFYAETAAKRPVKPEGPAGATPNNFMAVASGTVGVGLSPQLDALNRQITIQEDMANSLRTLIERDQAETGFKTDKFFPSSRRPDFSR